MLYLMKPGLLASRKAVSPACCPLHCGNSALTAQGGRLVMPYSWQWKPQCSGSAAEPATFLCVWKFPPRGKGGAAAQKGKRSSPEHSSELSREISVRFGNSSSSQKIRAPQLSTALGREPRPQLETRARRQRSDPDGLRLGLRRGWDWSFSIPSVNQSLSQLDSKPS